MDLETATYRELQAECKARRLKAVGTMEDLKRRLKSSMSHKQNPLAQQNQKDAESQPSPVDRTETRDEEAILELATSSLVPVEQACDPEGETLEQFLDRRRRRGRCSDDIHALVEAMQKASAEISEGLKSNHEKLVKQQLRLESLDKSVSSMTLSLPSYHSARNRFLSTFKKDKLGRATRDDRKIIAEGNATAKAGDAAADALLYQGTWGRRDFTTFEKLYGLAPETVRKINHSETLVILNTHAGVLASYDQTGSPRFYNLFNDFIRLFSESGIGFDVTYLVGSPTEVTNAYWAFINCIKTEVTWVKSSNHKRS